MNPAPADPSTSAQRWTLALLTAALALIVIYLLRYILLPFAVAGGLAFVAGPAVRWQQARLRFPRWLAALVPLGIVLLFLGAAAVIVQRYVVPDVLSLLADRRTIVERFLKTLLDGKTLSMSGRSYTAHDAADMLLNNADAWAARADPLPLIGFGAAALMSAFLTVILLLYFLVDGPRIGRGVMWMVPPALRPSAAAVGRRAGPMVFRYVGGVIVVTLYATLLTWVVTRFVLHLPHAEVLAIAVGLLEMIPVIGPILAIVVICLVAVQQMTFWTIIGTAIFLVVLRLSIDQLVGPLVLGKSVNLPPPVIILALMAGGAIFGILGVLIAIPVSATIKIMLEEAYGVGDDRL